MTIKEISSQVHKNAKNKGFWNKDKKMNSDKLCKKLLLIISELSEAMEADRKGKYCKLPPFPVNTGGYGIKEFERYFSVHIKDTFEDELADATIRIFDLAEKMNINLEKHILAKHAYNCNRPKMHGKKY